MLNKCSTCRYDLSIWTDNKQDRCSVEESEEIHLGYPGMGRDCEHYSRVPGSDDDLEQLSNKR